jgi:hypothetical protein
VECDPTQRPHRLVGNVYDPYQSVEDTDEGFFDALTHRRPGLAGTDNENPSSPVEDTPDRPGGVAEVGQEEILRPDGVYPGTPNGQGVGP